MTSLGVDLSRLITLANLQEGLKHCIAPHGAGRPGPAPRRRPGR
jgi:hypothetical protein